jgi:hypothetical protein
VERSPYHPSVASPDLEDDSGYHEDYQKYYYIEYYFLGCHVPAWDVEVYIFDGWDGLR